MIQRMTESAVKSDQNIMDQQLGYLPWREESMVPVPSLSTFLEIKWNIPRTETMN